MANIAFMNAAGWAKTVGQARRLARVPTLTHIVLGSYTIQRREGNTGGTNFRVAPDGTAVNSLGLPNGGILYLEEHGRQMIEVIRDAGKIPVLSIAGFAPSEFGSLAEIASELGAIPELNVGCPNVHDAGKQKAIISYDWLDLQRTLEVVCLETIPATPVWLKLSPYSNPTDLQKAANIANKFANCVQAVVGCNTFPNVSLYHDNGRPLIDVADNYAGMSGAGMRHISLSQCRRYRELLHPSINVIRTGGIAEARDAKESLRVGCSGMQIGAAFFDNENFRVFEEVAEGLLEAA